TSPKIYDYKFPAVDDSPSYKGFRSLIHSYDYTPSSHNLLAHYFSLFILINNLINSNYHFKQDSNLHIIIRDLPVSLQLIK
ncbi:hypothetical protein ACNR90_000037, partial (mitochondrion) [Candidozyma auris]